MLPLFERPIGILHFGLMCAACVLFVHQGLVNQLLYRAQVQERYRLQARLCFSSAAYALANIVGYLPMAAVWKVQILQLQWTAAIWVVITYVHALQAYLDVQLVGLQRVVTACRTLVVVPLAGIVMLAATGTTFFYEMQPQSTASFIWNATGNVASYSPVTHAFVGLSFLTMCVIIYLIMGVILRRPKPDRWLVFGVCFTGLSATAEGLIGGLGINDAVPVFYLANAVEILRITYVSTLQAGSRAALLQREQAEQRETIARQMELLQASAKWSKVGQMTGHIGHEIRNPLSAAHSWLQVAQNRVGTEQALVGEPLRKAREALDHLDSLVAGLGTIAREDRQDAVQTQSLQEAVEQAGTLCRHRLSEGDCELTVEVDPALAVDVRPSELVQVLINLISNACDAVEALDTRCVHVSATDAEGAVCISVADSGTRPPAAVRERMFKPFYTTKPQGQGTGIGLSICQQIVEGYGGHIELAGEAKHTTLRLWLPHAPPT